MLKADSSTLNSESDVHRSAAAPTIPSVVALSCTAWTRLTIWSIGVPGNACLISRTRKLDSSARPASPRSESEERQRHERQEREVRDHRSEVRATIGEELLREI